jgi:hypothetical protein
MIVKIFKPVKGFPAVRYNTSKIDRGKGELMKAVNFGVLGAMGKVRPNDYQDYLLRLANLNKRVVYPQFHAVISSEGKTASKAELTDLAEQWLQMMGYAEQPYLIVFHKDTANNHVHLVTSRVDRNGQKINSAFEHNRAIQALNKIVGLDEDQAAIKDLKDALSYRLTTKAQFALILEARGYTVREEKLIKFGKSLLDIPPLEFRLPDLRRAKQLAAIIEKYRHQYAAQLVKKHGVFHSELSEFLRVSFGLELIFHTTDDKPPYGYTIIDHAQKSVFKGSEVLKLATLLQEDAITFSDENEAAAGEFYSAPVSIFIADDVDDQQIHGMRRKRQRKAGTNTR